MKIMTFNTQHCASYLDKQHRIDFDLMAKAIRMFDPDVVGLNEMRGQGPTNHPDFKDQVAILSELTEMKHYYFAPAIELPDGLYGNGLLSKTPFLSVEKNMIPDPVERGYDGYYETRCIIKAVLEGGITVLVTHMGLNPDEQENAVNTVISLVEDKKCVLMGDFNMQPENPILTPIFDRMTDTATFFDSEKMSFPSDAPDRKIDYIFVSGDVKVDFADIPSVVASDHRPHVAIVDMR